MRRKPTRVTAMMYPETRLRIYMAAEDWVHGLTAKELAAKYMRSQCTIYEWMKTDAWTQAVAGRERQKRKSAVYLNRFDDFSAIQLTAKRFVAAGKPEKDAFAKHIGISKKKLDAYMQSPFWASIVLYAEDEIQRRASRKAPRRVAGEKFPYHLLEQAVFLDLAGWSSKDIGPVVGRNYRTIEDWRRMDVWFQTREKMIVNKLMMHLLHKGLTIQDLFRQICESQGI